MWRSIRSALLRGKAIDLDVIQRFQQASHYVCHMDTRIYFFFLLLSSPLYKSKLSFFYRLSTKPFAKTLREKRRDKSQEKFLLKEKKTETIFVYYLQDATATPDGAAFYSIELVENSLSLCVTVKDQKQMECAFINSPRLRATCPVECFFFK